MRPVRWKVLAERTVFTCPIFDIRVYQAERTKGSWKQDFFVLQNPIWVNIVPITDHGRIVMVRQYRFGSRSVTLEIPGGLAEPGEQPADAALRELLEETGYTGRDLQFLGAVHPNPATHNNQCYCFTLSHCRKTANPQPDAGEDIDVVLVNPESISAKILSGEISHSLVLNAFYLYHLSRRDLDPESPARQS